MKRQTASQTAPSDRSRTVADVLARTNRERTTRGLRALSSEPALTRAAQNYAEMMAARNHFDHRGPDDSMPWDRAKRAGYRYRRIAENIAFGQPDAVTVMTGWMKSPGHRENILTPELTQIGVGVAKNSRGRVYWVQLFGTPLSG